MKVILKDVRISYAKNLFVKDDDDKFGSTFLIPKGKEAQKELEKAIDQVGKDAFAVEWPDIKENLQVNNKLITHDGKLKKSKYPHYEGMTYFTAKNQIRPDVRDRKAVPVTESDGLFYSGCYANVILDVSAYHSKARKANFVSAKLLGVQFVRDGERLSGATTVADDNDYEVIEKAEELNDI